MESLAQASNSYPVPLPTPVARPVSKRRNARQPLALQPPPGEQEGDLAEMGGRSGFGSGPPVFEKARTRRNFQDSPSVEELGSDSGQQKPAAHPQELGDATGGKWHGVQRQRAKGIHSEMQSKKYHPGLMDLLGDRNAASRQAMRPVGTTITTNANPSRANKARTPNTSHTYDNLVLKFRQESEPPTASQELKDAKKAKRPADGKDLESEEVQTVFVWDAGGERGMAERRGRKRSRGQGRRAVSDTRLENCSPTRPGGICTKSSAFAGFTNAKDADRKSQNSEIAANPIIGPKPRLRTRAAVSPPSLLQTSSSSGSRAQLLAMLIGKEARSQGSSSVTRQYVPPDFGRGSRRVFGEEEEKEKEEEEDTAMSIADSESPDIMRLDEEGEVKAGVESESGSVSEPVSIGPVRAGSKKGRAQTSHSSAMDNGTRGSGWVEGVKALLSRDDEDEEEPQMDECEPIFGSGSKIDFQMIADRNGQCRERGGARDGQREDSPVQESPISMTLWTDISPNASFPSHLPFLPLSPAHKTVFSGTGGHEKRPPSIFADAPAPPSPTITMWGAVAKSPHARSRTRSTTTTSDTSIDKPLRLGNPSANPIPTLRAAFRSASLVLTDGEEERAEMEKEEHVREAAIGQGTDFLLAASKNLPGEVADPLLRDRQTRAAARLLNSASEVEETPNLKNAAVDRAVKDRAEDVPRRRRIGADRQADKEKGEANKRPGPKRRKPKAAIVAVAGAPLSGAITGESTTSEHPDQRTVACTIAGEVPVITPCSPESSQEQGGSISRTQVVRRDVNAYKKAAMLLNAQAMEHPCDETSDDDVANSTERQDQSGPETGGANESGDEPNRHADYRLSCEEEESGLEVLSSQPRLPLQGREAERYCRPLLARTKCRHCSGDMPRRPSAALKVMVRKLAELESARVAPVHWTRSIATCDRHFAEAKTWPLGLQAGYPRILDMETLEKRLLDRERVTRVRKLAKLAQRSAFFVKIKGDIDEVGKARWASKEHQWSEGVINILKPGYYGDAGRRCIETYLEEVLLSSNDLPPQETFPLTPSEFVSHVMVIEIAIMLIREDMEVARSTPTHARAAAIGVLNESKEYGRTRFADDSEWVIPSACSASWKTRLGEELARRRAAETGPADFARLTPLDNVAIGVQIERDLELDRDGTEDYFGDMDEEALLYAGIEQDQQFHPKRRPPPILASSMPALQTGARSGSNESSEDGTRRRDAGASLKAVRLAGRGRATRALGMVGRVSVTRPKERS